MAAKKAAIVETTQPEGSLMFIVINQANTFDPVNTQRFDTEEEADAKATEMLMANPGLPLLTAKLLKSFKAAVTVGSDPI